MTRLLTGTLIVLVLVAVAQAQSAVAGKWEGTTKSGSHIVLDLTATQGTLKGTINRNDQKVPITDGKVSKNTVTFKSAPNGPVEIFKGKLDGDELTVWMDRQGEPSAIVFTRVKK